MSRQKGNATVIELVRKAEDKIAHRSMQLEDFTNVSDVISPPYDPRALLQIIEESSDLKQYIRAMATNIAMHGHAIRYKPDFDYNKAEQSIQNEADKEWDKLERLYKYINPTEEFKKVLEKMLIDRESIGWGTIEVIRDMKGEVTHLEYCRAANIRIAKSDRNHVEFEVWEKDDNGEYTKMTYYKKFKKFVQVINGRKRYFKEFGDPRDMNYETGEYDKNIPEEKKANEIAFFPIHDPSTDYGIPRWTGALVNAVGSRASEVLNFIYFESGTILPAAIIVDGGQLTEESIEALKEGKGLGNAFKLLLLETAPFEDEDTISVGEDKKNRVSTKIEKLADTMNKDALFQEYQRNNKEKLRDTFRLPPIFTGQSSDYTRATADVARQIAEEQIFTPEREDIASRFNTIINNELGIKYVEMYLKGPQIRDVADKAEALEPFIKAGAVTPNMLIETLGELLNKNLDPLPDEIGNIPFELVKMKYMQDETTLQEVGKLQKADKTVDILSEMMQEIKKYLREDDE